MTLTLHPSSIATGPEEQRDALAAPVRDPLWFLARQWQTGAFIASDGGTPVHVALRYTTAPLTLDRAPLYGPVEPTVEAERLPAVNMLDTHARVELASELIRRLRDADLTSSQIRTLRATLVQDYPMHAIEPGAPLTSLTDRLPDPTTLHEVLAGLGPGGTGEPFPSIPALDVLDPAAATAARLAVRGWYEWTTHQVVPTGAGSTGRVDPAHWDPHHLDYAFTLTAVAPGGATSLSAGGDVTLHAAGYDGSGLDWHAFDRDRLVSGLPPQDEPQVTVRPAPVSYPGMPRPRFWEFEDGHVNLDALRPSEPGDQQNPAFGVLAMFAHQYSNDWFLFPLEVPAGVCTITALQVTDTFGTVVSVPAVASLDAEAGPWHLWDLTPTGERVESISGSSGADVGARVFLPSAPPPLEGPILEEVLLARDEMANLAWAIELTTRNLDGDRVDRYQRWLTLRPPSDPTFNPAASPASRYRLGTTVPDFWYPLVATTDAGNPVLVLAELPPEATEVSDHGVRGHLINHDAVDPVADEEVPRAGVRLVVRDRLSLGANGPVVWRARMKSPGQGESSSGLRFDILQ